MENVIKYEENTDLVERLAAAYNVRAIIFANYAEYYEHTEQDMVDYIKYIYNTLNNIYRQINYTVNSMDNHQVMNKEEFEYLRELFRDSSVFIQLFDNKENKKVELPVQIIDGHIGYHYPLLNLFLTEEEVILIHRMFKTYVYNRTMWKCAPCYLGIKSKNTSEKD